MILVPIQQEPNAVRILYDLLLERPPEAAISHKRMPTFEEHAAFVRGHPYEAWYLLVSDNQPAPEHYVGSIYLTKQREVGIFIFKCCHGLGYGRRAIALLREAHPGRLLANVAPGNAASHEFFKKLGATLIQSTYELA